MSLTLPCANVDIVKLGPYERSGNCLALGEDPSNWDVRMGMMNTGSTVLSRNLCVLPACVT